MSNIKFMIPCEEANHICDKAQYKNASLKEKILLSIHILFCKACRKYSDNNAKLTKTIQKSNVECLDKKCKEAMKKDFNKVLNEVSN